MCVSREGTYMIPVGPRVPPLITVRARPLAERHDERERGRDLHEVPEGFPIKDRPE